MEHDLLSTNILFDGGYTSKPDNKQSLFESWKKHFESRKLNFENKSGLQTVLLVDFMSMIRRMSLSKLAVFEELFTTQHRGRSNPSATFRNCLGFLIATLRTWLKKVNVNGDFWSAIRASSHSRRYEDTCSTWSVLVIFQQQRKSSGPMSIIIHSSCNWGWHSVGFKRICFMWDCTRISSGRKSVILPELNSKVEEADQRLIPHTTIQLAKVPNNQ